MHAERGSTISKRFNRRKPARDPPLATVSNTCNPARCIEVNRDIFFGIIYPMAIRNGWIPKSDPVLAPLSFTSGLLDPSDPVLFPPNTYFASFRGTIGASGMVLTFSDGQTLTVPETSSPGIKVYDFTIDPTGIQGTGSTPVISVPFSQPVFPIVSVDTKTNTSFENITYTAINSIESTRANFSRWK